MLSSRPLIRAARRHIYTKRLFSAAPSSADRVRIVEVGPRDGLQNEKATISVATKIELVRRLATTGLETIEAGSFVHPKWVPQMANSDQILAHVLHTPPPSPHPITYQWLLPNVKGLTNYLTAHAAAPSPPPASAPPHEVSIFLAATESFSQRNTNCSIAESLTRFTPLLALAKTHATPVRAYISVALGCPYEGPRVSASRVASLAVALLELGATEISVADTTGMGTAGRTQAVLSALAAAGVRMEQLACHFHDTYGMALVNTVVALEAGVRVFDASVAGLGGCPYSPGATGNVATEDVLHLCESLGVETGVDLKAVAEVGDWVSRELGRKSASRAGKAVLARVEAGVSPGST